MTEKELQERADKIYPIIPLKLREDATSGEILNDDEMLESFRLTIQSTASNMAYVHGYKDAQNNHCLRLLGFLGGLVLCWAFYAIFF